MELEALVQEQVEYYRRRAIEYDVIATPPDDSLAVFGDRQRVALDRCSSAEIRRVRGTHSGRRRSPVVELHLFRPAIASPILGRCEECSSYAFTSSKTRDYQCLEIASAALARHLGLAPAPGGGPPHSRSFPHRPPQRGMPTSHLRGPCRRKHVARLRQRSAILRRAGTPFALKSCSSTFRRRMSTASPSPASRISIACPALSVSLEEDRYLPCGDR
jgi:hypothetical protein